ncbi:hypothetical protein Btru_031259 [Bulinus truncatus]|nr:hypothetical protein Btru_031259 [Bulinus truncatus]
MFGPISQHRRPSCDLLSLIGDYRGDYQCDLRSVVNMYNNNNNYKRISNSSRRGFPYHWFGESDPRFYQLPLPSVQNETSPGPLEQRVTTPPVSPERPLTKSEKNRLGKAERQVNNEDVSQGASAPECQETLSVTDVSQGASAPKCQMTSSVTDSAKCKRESTKTRTRQEKKKSRVKRLSAGHALQNDRSVKSKNATRRTTSKSVNKSKGLNHMAREINLCTSSNKKENSEAGCSLPVASPELGACSNHDVYAEDDDSIPTSKSSSNSDPSEFSTDQSPTSTSRSEDGQYPDEHQSDRHASDLTKQKPLSDVSSEEVCTEDKKESPASTSDKNKIAIEIIDTPTSRHSLSNGSIEEGVVPRRIKQKRPVRRNILNDSDSGVHSSSQQMSSCTDPSNSFLEPMIESPPKIFMPGTHKCELLEKDMLPPPQKASGVSFLGPICPPSYQESQVLSYLASTQNLEYSYSISAEAENQNIWGSNNQYDYNWTTHGLFGSAGVSTPSTSSTGAQRASTPKDPMDRPILACKGPWVPPPNIPPPPSSPLVQPSDIAPIDTNIMGNILSGVQLYVNRSFSEAKVNIPKCCPFRFKDLTAGFSRTPGKRDLLLNCNAQLDFSSAPYDSKAEFDNLVPYAPIVTTSQSNEPKRGISQTQGNEVTAQQVNGQQVTGQQMTGQQMTGQQVTGQQVTGQQMTGKQVTGKQVTGQQVTGQHVAETTDQNQEDMIKEREIFEKRIQRVDEELIKEMQKRRNFERQVRLILKEERDKLIHNLKRVTDCITNLALKNKLYQWISTWQHSDTTEALCESLQEPEEHDEETTLAKVRANHQSYIYLINHLTELAIQSLESKPDRSNEDSEKNSSDLVTEGACCANSSDLVTEGACCANSSDLVTEGACCANSSDLVTEGACCANSSDLVTEGACCANSSDLVTEGACCANSSDLVTEGTCCANSSDLVTEGACCAEENVSLEWELIFPYLDAESKIN